MTMDLFGTIWVDRSLAIIGIALAYVFYRRSKTHPEISYQMIGTMLIGGPSALPSSVEVRYDGVPVPRLARSTGVIWNSGNTTIDNTASLRGDPLRLEVAVGGEILAVEIGRATRPIIQFQATVEQANKSQVILRFDFLDPGDGAVVNVLHTSESVVPNLKGTLKGLPRGFNYCGSFEHRRPPPKNFWEWVGRAANFIFSPFLLFGPMLAGLSYSAFLSARSLRSQISEGLRAQSLPSLIFEITMIGMFLWIFISLVSMFTRRRCPIKLAIETRSE